MWLKHSDLFLLWSKDLMPAQGVPGASPYLTTPKVPCVPQLLCCMSARAISAGAAPVSAFKESSQSSEAAPE